MFALQFNKKLYQFFLCTFVTIFFLFSLMLMSKNGSSFSSNSYVNLIDLCSLFNFLWNFSNETSYQKIQNMSSVCQNYSTGLFLPSVLKIFFSNVPMKQFAMISANGFLILTPSICVYNFFIILK